MLKEGFHLNHGADDRAVAIISEGHGTVLWIRDFVTIGSALDVLDDEVLEGHDRSAIHDNFRKGGFHTTEYEIPEGGLTSYAFQKYVLERT